MSLRFVQNKFDLPPPPAHVRRGKRNPLSSTTHLRHNADQLFCQPPPPPAVEEREKPSPICGEFYVKTQ
ncbi:hypothetical protein TNCV_4250261 [Trichonephila clavipes]|nr:hypothetical protein TNCV_4250261 [Trichonephila clavipes]